MSYVVRRVLPTEYGKYRTHLKSLDRESKYLRFGCAANDDMIDRLCDGFEKNHEQHILFCIENAHLEFIAIGHIALVDSMELAFSVLKDHQDQGLGSSLMKRCIQWCRVNGIERGCMICLPHNDAIKHLCTKHSIHFHTEDGETSAEVELDKPSIDTYVSERLDSNLAVLDYTFKRFWSFTA